MSSIPYVSFSELSDQLDTWGTSGVPFVFFVNYDQSQAWAGSREDAARLGIQIAVQQACEAPKQKYTLVKYPISYESYYSKFELVQKGLRYGDSFLLNLTAETPIETDASLLKLFEHAQAAYKLKVQEHFVVFSPECFVQIRGNQLYSYPMKGTAAANKQGPDSLRNNPKEQAEHATIVDLIRNDLSQVAFPVHVDQYKCINQVKNNEGNLWQMSSEISGTLLPHLQGRIGQILGALLPAGSITGAPKPATMRIIREAEDYDRGFYTGIMGEFDGQNLDTGVMIRYIEQRANQKLFKSGGGITVYSDPKKEYHELIQKVYLPF